MDKFIELKEGELAEKKPAITSSGGVDGGRLVALDENTGKLDPSVMPSGIGADNITATCSDNLSPGNLVNLWVDGGVLKARKANASLGYRASGFVLDAGSVGNTIQVSMEGSMVGLGAIVPGLPYFLSESTPGTHSDSPPTSSDFILQEIGTGRSLDSISFEPQSPVLLA